MGNQGSPPKRAILMWGGLKQIKEKKKVTFAYLPAYKDDEDNNRFKKVAKDVPDNSIVVSTTINENI